MTLVEQITKDLTAAMKNQDKFTLSVLRMLKSSIQLEKISKNHDLNDEEAIAVIKKQVKMRRDSIEEFTKYGKTEEIENLQKEIDCLSVYLPEEMPIEEVNQIIDEIIAELKPTGIKDMGKIMKEATDRFKGRADMSAVSKIVKEKLQ